MTQAQTIAHYRPSLFALALKLVGSVQDAEDIIQEAFLSWLSVDQSKIDNTKAYLTRTVVNKCLNHLKWLNQRKSECIDNIKHMDFKSELFEKIDFSHLDLSHEISAALATIQHKLKPLEKVAFLLREVFDYDYDELQVVVNQRKDYCRQLVHRAKEKLATEPSNMSVNFSHQKELLEKFKNACTVGHISGLVDHLTRRKEK